MHFLGNMLDKKLNMPTPENALKGRAEPVATAATHFVNGRDLHAPAPEGHETVFFAMGNYWGAERLFWQVPGVWGRRDGLLVQRHVCAGCQERQPQPQPVVAAGRRRRVLHRVGGG